MIKIFMGLILCLLSASVRAETQDNQNINNNGLEDRIHLTSESRQALASCSAYEENLTAADSDSKDKNDNNSPTQQVILQIYGWENDLCHFSLDYKYIKDGQPLPQGMRENCLVDNDILYKLTEIVKDVSVDQYTDLSDVTEKDGSFNAIYGEIKSSLCTQEAITFDTDAETEESPAQETEDELTPEEFATKYNLFSPQFMMSLQNCQPNTEIREIGNIRYTIEILKKQGQYCKVKYGKFDLTIPMDIILNVRGFDDIKTLLKNKDIAFFNYQPEYDYDGLIHAFNACHNKHSYYSLKKIQRVNEVEMSRSMNAEYYDNACVINLTNDVEYDGEVRDYGVMCRLTDETIDEIWPIFKDTLEKYGEKQISSVDGEKKTIQGINNKETKDADIALMYYMQQQEYCRKPEIK